MEVGALLQAISFYVFAGVAVASGVMVISARNPVHSVLFLILAFFNAAGLFVLLGAEFLAMILVIVYVGAVAVLFLFVVMMLDINFVALRRGLPAVFAGGRAGRAGAAGRVDSDLRRLDPVARYRLGCLRRRPRRWRRRRNTAALGRAALHAYIYAFQVAGLILLVAMIGAIVLTLRSRDGVRRQKIGEQVARRREASVEARQSPAGAGASEAMPRSASRIT